MTKYLINISNHNFALKKFNNNWFDLKNFLHSHKMDGIELIAFGEDNLNTLPNNLLHGMHLRYYPCWIDFYNQNFDNLKEEFKSIDEIKNYYGSLSPDSIVKKYKIEFQKAKKFNSKYMVFHVSDVSVKEAYTFNFKHSDYEVLDASIDLINKSFNEDSNIELLFENLWWPGLTLLDYKKTKYFLDNINYKNKGIMLDLSHLMLTNLSLKNLDDSTNYILKILDSLKEVKRYIKGIHINMSLPGEYIKNNSNIGEYNKILSIKNAEEKYSKIHEHIKNIDWHIPYNHHSINKIINAINPKYIVYEFMANDLDTLNNYIKLQNEFIKR